MHLLKRISHLFEPKAIVLMYHRIADLSYDPWQLAVTPENFEQHLQVLQRTGKLITAGEMVSNLYQSTIEKESVCITFDDGYSDNYLVAKPLLEKYQSAATFFIPAGYPGQLAEFWWDELTSICLEYPYLPELLTLSVRGEILKFDFGDNNKLTEKQVLQHKLWVWPEQPPTRRCKLYLDIWSQLKSLPYKELQSAITEIKLWASFQTSSETKNYPMSLEQLYNLAGHPFIDAGIHTVTHVSLSYHTAKVQLSEISDSRLYLEKIFNIPVNTIAYPYGDFNNNTLSVTKQLRLTAGFTTAEKIVSNKTDPYLIGRFHVKNWNGEEFEKQMINWRRSSRFL